MTEKNAKNLGKKELSDEEIEQAIGGNGHFTVTTGLNTIIHSCECAPDDQTFKNYFTQTSTGCPNYIWSGTPVSNGMVLCQVCAHYNKTQYSIFG